ncbi:MAG: ATP-binding cassette domain-containing protein [Elusimicrobiales bacterium]|nr:ATP-binding cassette domain-containing protein [Elusimicrobiales bacterium]
MQIRNLSFSYNNHKIFDDINIDIPNGINIITGPNSSGKTTLWRILCGLIPNLYYGKISGKIFLDGKKDFDIIYVGQDNDIGLMHEKVLDEVIFYSSIKSFKFKNVNDFFTFWDLSDLQEKKSDCLSYGQKQRYFLSLSLSFENDGVFIFDEPFAYLDDDSFSFIAEVFKKVREKKVIIFSHYFNNLDSIADRFFKIEKFRVIESKESLFESKLSLTSASKGRKLIEIVDLKNQYIKKKITTEIREGDIKLIYGKNGSGKSSFLKILCGYDRVYSGSIRFLDNTWYSNLFYIPPNPDLRIFANNILELFNGKINVEIFKHLNILDKITTPISWLSYGEKQKVLIAYSIILGKKIIVIDEPLMSFDRESSIAISWVLNEYVKNGGSVLIASPSKKNLILKDVEVIEL